MRARKPSTQDAEAGGPLHVQDLPVIPGKGHSGGRACAGIKGTRGTMGMDKMKVQCQIIQERVWRDALCSLLFQRTSG